MVSPFANAREAEIERLLEEKLAGIEGRPAPEPAPGPGLEEAAARWAAARPGDRGRVISVRDSIASLSGLKNARLNAVVEFSDGSRGLVAAVGRETVQVLLLGSDRPDLAAPGHGAARLVDGGEPLSIPVGDALKGRVVTPLGEALPAAGAGAAGAAPSAAGHGGSPHKFPNSPRAPVFPRSASQTPGLAARTLVCEPLRTGMPLIDVFFPLGVGQAAVVSGPRGTGKTELAVRVAEAACADDAREGAAANARGCGPGDLHCVFVTVGRAPGAVDALRRRLERSGAMRRSTIVAAGAGASAAEQMLSFFAGARIAAACRDAGGHALLVLDDAVHHADVCRQIVAHQTGVVERSVGSEAGGGGGGRGREFGRLGGAADRLDVRSACSLPPGSLGPAGASASVRAGRLLGEAGRLAASSGGGALTVLALVDDDAQRQGGPSAADAGGHAEIARLASQVLEGCCAAADVRLELSASLAARRSFPALPLRAAVGLPPQPYQSAAAAALASEVRSRFAAEGAGETAEAAELCARFGVDPEDEGRPEVERARRIRDALQALMSAASSQVKSAAAGRATTYCSDQIGEDAGPARALVAAFAAARGGVDAVVDAEARGARGGGVRGDLRASVAAYEASLWDEVRSDARLRRWTEALAAPRASSVRGDPAAPWAAAGVGLGAVPRGSASGAGAPDIPDLLWRPLRSAVRRATAKHLERRGLGAAETAGARPAGRTEAAAAGERAGAGDPTRAISRSAPPPERTRAQALQARRRQAELDPPNPFRLSGPSPAGGTAGPRAADTGGSVFSVLSGLFRDGLPGWNSAQQDAQDRRRRAREAQERETRLAARRRAAAPVGKDAEGGESSTAAAAREARYRMAREMARAARR
jgi:hypothetical protein